MSQIAGTKAEVKFDQMANALIIQLDGAEPVTPEEVIHYLSSESLPPRTRTMLNLRDTAQKATEIGSVLILYLKGVWQAWIELDIVDALRNLFREKGYQCA